MEIHQIAQCNKALDFRPLKSGSVALPVFTWGSVALNGFDRPASAPTVDLKSDSSTWYELMASLHSELSLMEAARLYFCVQNLSKTNKDFQVPTTEWLQSFGFQFHSKMQQIFAAACLWPKGFQDWCAAKNLSERELRPLLLVPPDALMAYLEKLASLEPTRSEGGRLLETLVEVLLMELPEDQIQEAFGQDSAKLVLTSLLKLRYPERSNKQDEMLRRARRLSWPKRSQLQWNFQKDQPSLDIKFSLTSEEDVVQLSESLNRIEEKLKEDQDNPWRV